MKSVAYSTMPRANGNFIFSPNINILHNHSTFIEVKI